jgi:hypothetical protein
MNGRVDASIPPKNLDYGNNMNSLFALQDKIPAKQCISLRDPLEGIWTSNEISERFFSPINKGSSKFIFNGKLAIYS